MLRGPAFARGHPLFEELSLHRVAGEGGSEMLACDRKLPGTKFSNSPSARDRTHFFQATLRAFVPSDGAVERDNW
jgi:hypothetical protein